MPTAERLRALARARAVAGRRPVVLQPELPGMPPLDRPRWATLREGGEPTRAGARARRRRRLEAQHRRA